MTYVEHKKLYNLEATSLHDKAHLSITQNKKLNEEDGMNDCITLRFTDKILYSYIAQVET